MAEAEETPAQRQARIRRQKREAKITANASDRLDKITRLSGRTPESIRNETPPATPPQSSTPPRTSTPSAGQLPSPPLANTEDPVQLQAQEDYLRTLLRAPMSETGQNPSQNQGDDDPMMKMLQAMMGGMDPNNPDAMGGGGGGIPGLSPEDLSKATGLPSFVTNMFMGGQKAAPTKAEEQATRFWRMLHVIFALVCGLYMVYSIEASIRTFGENPPAPATFQNPFIVFSTGELLVQGARVLSKGTSGKSGITLWYQMLREFIGDGAIVVFMLGIAFWWKGRV